MNTYNPKKYFSFHQQTVTKLVDFLAEHNIHSREDLLRETDDDATAKQFEVWDGLGPVMAKLLVHLRGDSIESWRKITGLPAFNDAEIEQASIESTKTPE